MLGSGNGSSYSHFRGGETDKNGILNVGRIPRIREIDQAL